MRYIVFGLVLIACISVANAQDAWKNIYTESAWKERDQWQEAEKIIDRLGLRMGSKVADVGCHEGYMSLKLAKVVGNLGRVYAVDIEQNRLDRLQEHAAQSNVVNIIPIKGNYDDPHLPPNTLDAVLIIDTYHEMDDHEDMLAHVRESLQVGGKLVICEPIAFERRKLARAEQERKHELGMEYAIEDVRKAGLKIIFKQDPFIDREKIKGDKMWLIVAEKVQE